MANDKAKALSAILEKKDTDVIAEHLTVASREARMRFGKIVENARTDKNQFVITEHGEPAAALISISDLKDSRLDEAPQTQRLLHQCGLRRLER